MKSLQTRFEIPRAVAGKFVDALKRTAGEEDSLVIEPAGDTPTPPVGQLRDRRGPPPRDQLHARPMGGPPRGGAGGPKRGPGGPGAKRYGAKPFGGGGGRKPS